MWYFAQKKIVSYQRKKCFIPERTREKKINIFIYGMKQIFLWYEYNFLQNYTHTIEKYVLYHRKKLLLHKKTKNILKNFKIATFSLNLMNKHQIYVDV